MHARFAPGSAKPSAGLLIRLFRLVVLILPVALLAIIAMRAPADSRLVFWFGALLQAVVCLFALGASRGGREPAGPVVIMLYVIALSWLLLGASGKTDWMLHLAQAVFLVVPLVFFANQCLRDSGASTMRRARQLAGRLAARRDWPADLMECRLLPEVKALREALHIDASPALELLANPNPAIRVAALAALEFRPSWRSGQPQVVLQLARRAPEPEIRAAALFALANVDDRHLVESLAELLRDPSALVRFTAMEALLWNSEQRWPWIRDAVHHALSDPTCESDGALRLTGNPLTAEAVTDLHSWSAEKGTVAIRSALTLGAYYHHLLVAGAATQVIDRLRDLVLSPGTPALLRLELARLLNQHRELNEQHLQRMLDQTMPAPVRLIAVESLLAQGPYPEAVATLHDLARLPNREIALTTADVVQRRLGIDLGLPRGQALPPVQSRAAAEIARRVHAWATQYDVSNTPAPHRDPRPSSYRSRTGP